MVAGGGLVPCGGRNRFAWFFLSLFPDISGKPVPVNRRSCSNRARTKGDIHRTVSSRASPDVCRYDSFHRRYNLLVRVVVLISPGVDTRHRDSISSGTGGTRAGGRTARIWRVYSTGEISPYPVCLVALDKRSSALDGVFSAHFQPGMGSPQSYPAALFSSLSPLRNNPWSSFTSAKSIIIFKKEGVKYIMNKILNKILTFTILLIIATSLAGCPPPWWGGGRHHYYRDGGYHHYR